MHFAIENKEDISDWMDVVANKESFNVNPILKSEIVNDKACDWYDAISLPKAFQFSYYVHSDLKDDILAESSNGENGGECFQVVLLESLEYSTSLDLKIDIIVISEKVEENRGKYDSVIFAESSEFPSSPNRIEHVKDSMQINTKQSEVYDEAWLFGKVLWVTMLQIAFGLKFSSQGLARRYQCCCKLVKHSPLCRKGSYFSLPINGHV